VSAITNLNIAKNLDNGRCRIANAAAGIVISARNVTKKFRLYDSPYARLQELLSFGLLKRHRDFWALKNINFDIKKGETVGLIGRNGSGKSTLLKMLCSVSQPTNGTISVSGIISTILELGVGFTPDLTGRENIYLKGILMGFSKEEMTKRIPQIEKFAEIGDYIDHPVKYYSDGMFVRLAFASAINIDPDILLVDEALAVGDLRFQQKCYSFFESFKEKKKTLLLVSHDLNLIKSLCDGAILLDKGKLVHYGQPDEVVDRYLAILFQDAHNGPVPVEGTIVARKEEKVLIDNTVVRIGTGEVDLEEVSILDNNDNEARFISSGQYFKIRFVVKTSKDLINPHYGISFRNNRGVELFGVNTYTMHLNPSPLKAGEKVTVEYGFDCQLTPGDYSISIGIADKGIEKKSFYFKEYLLSMQNVLQFKVVESLDSIIFNGYFNMKPIVKISKSS